MLLVESTHRGHGLLVLLDSGAHHALQVELDYLHTDQLSSYLLLQDCQLGLIFALGLLPLLGYLTLLPG